MKECRGNMFSYLGRMKFRLFITTNGFIKNDGTAVMGRGNAAQAVRIFNEEYEINMPEVLGNSLKSRGNVVSKLTDQLYSFPVKEHWADRASIRLIKKSLERLKEIIKEKPDLVYILPRPGCGNGNLKYKHVRPLLVDLPDNVWIICDWNDPQWEIAKEEHADRVQSKESLHKKHKSHRSVVRRQTKSHNHSGRRKSSSNSSKHKSSRKR